MQQLSGLDAAFLAMESETVQGHGGGICMLENESLQLSVEALRQAVRARLSRIPLFTSRLRFVPFGLDQPYWLENIEPDLDHHIRESRIGPAADVSELAELIAVLHAKRLNRDRPLWEMRLIHGLAGDRQAVYLKVHHAAIDGVSGNDLLTVLLDAEPDVLVVQRPSDANHRKADELSTIGLLGRAAITYLGHPRRVAGVAASLAGPLGGRLRNSRSLTGRVANLSPGMRAPDTPFNRSIGSDRAIALRTVRFDDILTVKRALGVTVNDVVLTACAASLRTWLENRSALPDKPLIAAIPVSTRTDDDGAALGNRLTMMFAALPTQLDDAAERARTVHDTMLTVKDVHAALPANLLTDLSSLAMPSLLGLAIRFSARIRLLETAAPFNLIISNVPGPRERLHLAGIPMQAYYPISQVVDGQGLNITVLSYNGGVHIGVLGDRQLVPDPDAIAKGIVEEVANLLAHVSV